MNTVGSTNEPTPTNTNTGSGGASGALTFH
jgi:hypothetical protein